MCAIEPIPEGDDGSTSRTETKLRYYYPTLDLYAPIISNTVTVKTTTLNWNFFFKQGVPLIIFFLLFTA